MIQIFIKGISGHPKRWIPTLIMVGKKKKKSLNYYQTTSIMNEITY